MACKQIRDADNGRNNIYFEYYCNPRCNVCLDSVRQDFYGKYSGFSFVLCYFDFELFVNE